MHPFLYFNYTFPLVPSQYFEGSSRLEVFFKTRFQRIQGDQATTFMEHLIFPEPDAGFQYKKTGRLDT